MLAGRADDISLVSRVSSPYNVNGVALACLPATLADEEYIRGYVEEVRRGREALCEQFARWGIRYWPSQANFVLASFGPLKTALHSSHAARGILVRDRSRDYGCEGCVRVTLGTDGTDCATAACIARDLAGNWSERGSGEMRRAAIERVTKETDIRAVLVIEGQGRYKISTGIRFFDHMLELFAHHGGFDLELTAKGRPGCRSAPHR